MLKRTLAGLIVAVVMASGGVAGPLDDADAAYKHGDYATVLKLLKQLAEQGDAKAQADLGVMYVDGKGAPPDYAEAAKWFRKADEQGYAPALFDLHTLYEYGKGNGNLGAVVKPLAEQGDAHAQNDLGIAYANGEEGVPDHAEAMKWFRLAVEQGEAYAQFNLGVMYDTGEGVPPDYAEAAKWFRKAAEQGNAERTDVGNSAQFLLGGFYEYGKGEPAASRSNKLEKPFARG